MPEFQCQYVNPKGTRCASRAHFRLYFSDEHLLDFVDVCTEHAAEYPKGLKAFEVLVEYNDPFDQVPV